MFNKIKSAMAITCVALAGVAAMVGGTAVAADGRSVAPAPLEGTWIVRIQPVVCATGDDVPVPPFVSYLTFNRGGTMIEMTSNPFFQPGQRSPGFGIWDRTGLTSYQMAWQAFIQFDGGPYTRGYQRIDQTVELQTNDEFTSTGTVQFFAPPATTPIPPSGCARSNGTRMY